MSKVRLLKDPNRLSIVDGWIGSDVCLPEMKRVAVLLGKLVLHIGIAIHMEEGVAIASTLHVPMK